jgi:hypothetical protein
MTDKHQDQERADRDLERSEEARWRVAEAGAEEEDEGMLDRAREPDTQQADSPSAPEV